MKLILPKVFANGKKKKKGSRGGSVVGGEAVSVHWAKGGVQRPRE